MNAREARQKRVFQVDALVLAAVAGSGSEGACQSEVYRQLNASSPTSFHWPQVNAALNRLTRRRMLDRAPEGGASNASVGEWRFWPTLDGLRALELAVADWRAMLDGLEFESASEKLRRELLGG